VRTFRPHIVHTHTSKAGMAGRAAALLAGSPRPVIVHTYHGHVLEGYFGRDKTRLYRAIERRLARVSARLICVSEANMRDLVRLEIAPPEKFRVIPIGLDLNEFLLSNGDAGHAFRNHVGAETDDVVVTYVGRLVPVKRVDVLLRAAAKASKSGTRLVLAIVGDGQLRERLERLALEVGLNGRARFLGYRTDLDAITAGTDIAALASDNEGTPVSLIQAAAAARPIVATDVGGVADVVPAEAGVLVPRGDHTRFGQALVELAGDRSLRNRMGSRAREHVCSRFSADRLIGDVEALYDEVLWEREGSADPGQQPTPSLEPPPLPQRRCGLRAPQLLRAPVRREGRSRRPRGAIDVARANLGRRPHGAFITCRIPSAHCGRSAGSCVPAATSTSTCTGSRRSAGTEASSSSSPPRAA